jgi:hypothetical protein
VRRVFGHGGSLISDFLDRDSSYWKVKAICFA